MQQGRYRGKRVGRAGQGAPREMAAGSGLYQEKGKLTESKVLSP